MIGPPEVRGHTATARRQLDGYLEETRGSKGQTTAHVVDDWHDVHPWQKIEFDTEIK